MQIIILEEPAGTPMALEHTLILTVNKSKGGILSLVITGIQTPQGFKALETKESPQDIGRKVNWAREMEAGRVPYDPDRLGFTAIKMI